MELIIEGLDKLAFKTFDGRKIYKIEVGNRGYPNDTSYVFTFGEIPKTPQSHTNAMGTGWESEFEVWLSKFPNTDGKYEMFVMGLHGVTCYEVPKGELISLDVFTPALGVVVSRGKKFWKSVK